MKKVFNILVIALILTILWILFLLINPNFSEVKGIKSVKTEYDNYYAEIDKKIEKEFDKNPKKLYEKRKANLKRVRLNLDFGRARKYLEDSEYIFGFSSNGKLVFVLKKNSPNSNNGVLKYLYDNQSLKEIGYVEGKDLVSVITNLKVGDAVVSTLQEDGSPSFAEVVSIYPPKSKLDAVDAFVRQQLVNQSPFYDKYAEMFDRESAHEQLLALEQQFQQEQEEALAQREAEKQAEAERKEAEKQEALAQKEAEKQAKLEEKERERQERELERQARQAATKKGDSAMDRFTKNIMSSVGREVGRVITRGVMGLFKK